MDNLSLKWRRKIIDLEQESKANRDLAEKTSKDLKELKSQVDNLIKQIERDKGNLNNI